MVRAVVNRGGMISGAGEFAVDSGHNEVALRDWGRGRRITEGVRLARGGSGFARGYAVTSPGSLRCWDECCFWDVVCVAIFLTFGGGFVIIYGVSRRGRRGLN